MSKYKIIDTSKEGVLDSYSFYLENAMEKVLAEEISDAAKEAIEKFARRLVQGNGSYRSGVYNVLDKKLREALSADVSEEELSKIATDKKQQEEALYQIYQYTQRLSELFTTLSIQGTGSEINTVFMLLKQIEYLSTQSSEKEGALEDTLGYITGRSGLYDKRLDPIIAPQIGLCYKTANEALAEAKAQGYGE